MQGEGHKCSQVDVGKYKLICLYCVKNETILILIPCCGAALWLYRFEYLRTICLAISVKPCGMVQPITAAVLETFVMTNKYGAHLPSIDMLFILLTCISNVSLWNGESFGPAGQPCTKLLAPTIFHTLKHLYQHTYLELYLFFYNCISIIQVYSKISYILF